MATQEPVTRRSIQLYENKSGIIVLVVGCIQQGGNMATQEPVTRRSIQLYENKSGIIVLVVGCIQQGGICTAVITMIVLEVKQS